MRVLLVDDHALFRAGIATLLRAWDFDVVGEAENGHEALELTRKLRPDLVLMDIALPGCSGLEATKLISAELPEVNIVMVTASEDDQDLFEAIKCGARGYLLKNMSEDDFSRTLHDVSKGEPALSPGLAAKVLEEFANPMQRAEKRVEHNLTRREYEVLEHVAAGATNRQIAAALFISENTVGFHMKNILAKLHLHSRAQAVAFAFRSGLATTDSPT